MTCSRTRVARTAECRREQKVGYGRHTDQTIPNTTKSEVFGVLWHLKKQGYSEYTINFVRKALNVLEKGCGLSDSEIVKAFIAEMEVADSYKRNLCYAYEHYLKLMNSLGTVQDTMRGRSSRGFQLRRSLTC